MPLYHINGLVVTLLVPLFHGGSVVMTPRFSARTFWRDVARYGCTWINVVPTIVAYLLNRRTRTPSISRRSSSAAARRRRCPPSITARSRRAFGIGVIETMGMTETAAPAFSNPYDATLRRVGSIGLPSGGEASVIDGEGRDCAPHECGEIVLRGEQVMSGYYKRPEETSAAFTADGWLRTGDLGYRDDGRLLLHQRPREGTDHQGRREHRAARDRRSAAQAPGVLEAAAVGVPDAAYGQEIVAFVVARVADGPARSTPRACAITACANSAATRRRRSSASSTELPRGPSGKVQRLKLLQT